MTDPRDTPELSETFTLVFRGDLRKIAGNPFKTETPFGVPVSAGMGNAFDKIESLEAALEVARTGLLQVERKSEETRAATSRAQGLS